MKNKSIISSTNNDQWFKDKRNRNECKKDSWTIINEIIRVIKLKILNWKKKKNWII